ncbi:unnamed protein product [Rangifer tarandus platyrhynchus]|uniref:RRM domain-containing protein n=1 Tax=Rangifer tarandus platyrhynchus TaxID=3082113 RepID=A0ABN8XIS1_RANTA|nr:unnamed protein product [Rangifer tarandus platyrhynchus]
MERQPAGVMKSASSRKGPRADKRGVGKPGETQPGKMALGNTAALQKTSRGVVYLGHIPSGFNEPQMFRFFSQFGEVVGVELRRSRKTGRSKGYAYIGFELPEVAEIVSETMNNYMMFGRTLVCHLVAPNRVPPRLFRHWGKRFRRVSTRVRAMQQHNKPDNALPSLRQVRRRLEKERKVAQHLKLLGLDHVALPSLVPVSDSNMAVRDTASEKSRERPLDKAATLSTSAKTPCPAGVGKAFRRRRNHQEKASGSHASSSTQKTPT